MTMAATTILVVDDQDELRLLISLSLQTLGRIVEAGNAEQALALFAAERPDVVMLDIWLGPGASGLDVCAQLRQDPANAGVKIVLLSACGQQSDVAAGMAAGADLYIVKPFSPMELIGAVASLLAKLPESSA
ncbi:DNA-binding response OmpR family regulator [Massilia sp. MP_M2]